MIEDRNYTGPQATAPYPEDKRMVTVLESAETIQNAIESMRQQRSELDYNIAQAEKRLANLSSDMLNPKQAGAQRVG